MKLSPIIITILVCVYTKISIFTIFRFINGNISFIFSIYAIYVMQHFCKVKILRKFTEKIAICFYKKCFRFLMIQGKNIVCHNTSLEEISDFTYLGNK